MNASLSIRPKITETVVAADVTLREVEIGQCCEILWPTYVEYATLGDYSYIGGGCGRGVLRALGQRTLTVQRTL